VYCLSAYHHERFLCQYYPTLCLCEVRVVSFMLTTDELKFRYMLTKRQEFYTNKRIISSYQLSNLYDIFTLSVRWWCLSVRSAAWFISETIEHISIKFGMMSLTKNCRRNFISFVRLSITHTSHGTQIELRKFPTERLSIQTLVWI
jgi:hypothetical protein